jgi:hypothetical protein
MGMLAKGVEVSALEIGRFLCDQKEPFEIVEPHNNALTFPDFSEKRIISSFEEPQNRLPALVTLPSFNFPSIFSCQPVVENILIYLTGSSNDSYKKQLGEDIYNFLTVNRRLSNEKEYWQTAFRVGFNSVLSPFKVKIDPKFMTYPDYDRLSRAEKTRVNQLIKQMKNAFAEGREEKELKNINLELNAESLRILFAGYHGKRLSQYNMVVRLLKENWLFARNLIYFFIKENFASFDVIDLVKVNIIGFSLEHPEEDKHDLCTNIFKRVGYLINKNGCTQYSAEEILEICSFFHWAPDCDVVIASKDAFRQNVFKILKEDPKKFSIKNLKKISTCKLIIGMKEICEILVEKLQTEPEEIDNMRQELVSNKNKYKGLLKEFLNYPTNSPEVETTKEIIKFHEKIPSKLFSALRGNNVLEKCRSVIGDPLQSSQGSHLKNELKNFTKDANNIEKFCDFLKENEHITLEMIRNFVQPLSGQSTDSKSKRSLTKEEKSRKRQRVGKLSQTS